MKKLIFAIVIVCTMSISGCTSDSDFQKGKRQLEAQGYHHIKNSGYNAFCCGEGDTYSTGFKAIDRNGNSVEGCFCSGVFKGITIRFD